MKTSPELPILSFENARLWREWLGKHHGLASGIWLKFAKKASGISSVSYDEALDEALCYGWIDGQLKRYDDKTYLQKFTPRRPGSGWSKRNAAKAAALITSGKMQPAGLAEVKAAQQDGRWEQAYDSPRNASVPADFQAALDQHPKAKAFFATLHKRNSYAFLYRIQTAKKPEIRQKRIKDFIRMLNEGKTFYP